MGSLTAEAPARPGTISTCIIPSSKTVTGTCPWPIVDKELPLCARHLAVAASIATDLGGQYLASIVKAEGR